MIQTNTSKAANLAKQANLLIGDYSSLEGFAARIIKARSKPIDTETPACRFRGSLIDFRAGSSRTLLTGWQRNVARIRKMDVSLPTIITLQLNNESIIEEVNLDPSFKGSKGLLCSWKYLNGNLKLRLEGRKFEQSFLHTIKQEHMHCAHIFEILSGLYSYYMSVKGNGFQEAAPEKFAYEEEVIDNILEGETIHSCGTHLLKGHSPIEYRLSLHDLMGKLRFDRDGTVKTAGGVNAAFGVNGTTLLRETITVNDPDTTYTDLTIFLLRCVKELKPLLGDGKTKRVLHTNLYPYAYVGLFTQMAAIRLFQANYNYVMHALTALQRPGKKPVCIGAVTDQAEADRFFPGLNLNELV